MRDLAIDARIQEGDHVHVDFNGSQYTLCSRAEVLYVPGSTGVSWIFKDTGDGRIHYVSEGCTITKLEKE